MSTATHGSDDVPDLAGISLGTPSLCWFSWPWELADSPQITLANSPVIDGAEKRGHGAQVLILSADSAIPPSSQVVDLMGNLQIHRKKLADTAVKLLADSVITDNGGEKAGQKAQVLVISADSASPTSSQVVDLMGNLQIHRKKLADTAAKLLADSLHSDTSKRHLMGRARSPSLTRLARPKNFSTRSLLRCSIPASPKNPPSQS